MKANNLFSKQGAFWRLINVTRADRIHHNLSLTENSGTIKFQEFQLGKTEPKVTRFVVFSTL